MKNILAVWLSAFSTFVHAQLEWLPDEARQVVFAGGQRSVRVMFRNPADHPVTVDFRTRVLQASSATVMPLGDPQPWKRLQVLAGQTVVESATISFPLIKTGTRFLVQWVNEQDKVFGPSEVIVYPPTLLKELNTLTGGTPTGVFDPQDQLKPALKEARVEFEELDETSHFAGRLAILGPFPSSRQMPANMIKRIKALSASGVAVIWIQPPPDFTLDSELLIQLVRSGNARVVVAPFGLFSRLSSDPRAQINLVRLAALVLKPERWELSLLTP
jgi:hypothetical protein